MCSGSPAITTAGAARFSRGTWASTYHVGPWRGSLGGWRALDRARRRSSGQGGCAVPPAARRAAPSARDPHLPMDPSRHRDVDRAADLAHEPEHAAARPGRGTPAGRARAARRRAGAGPLPVRALARAGARAGRAAAACSRIPGAWMDEPTFSADHRRTASNSHDSTATGRHVLHRVERRATGR